MPGEFAGLAQGLNQAINQYLGISIDNMKTQAAESRSMDQRKELMRYEQELKPKGLMIGAGNLKAGNPKLAPFLNGAPDDQPIPLEQIDNLSRLLPKDTGANSEDGSTSIEEFSALAEFLGHDKAAVEKLKKAHPQGIPNRNVNSLLVTPLKGKITDAKVADLAVKVLEMSGDMTPESLAATSKELARVVQKAPGTAKLDEGGYTSATYDALGELDKLVDGGMKADAALLKLGEELSSVFDRDTTIKILWNVRLKAKQAQNQGMDISDLIKNESKLQR